MNVALKSTRFCRTTVSLPLLCGPVRRVHTSGPINGAAWVDRPRPAPLPNLPAAHVLPNRWLKSRTFSTKGNIDVNTRKMSDPMVDAKRLAGHKSVDEHLNPEFTLVGIGSGSTVVFCVERIEQLAKAGKLDVSRMAFVPTGFQSKLLIEEAGLTLREISQIGGREVDVVFDGADEIDSNLNCIKGGGACLFQEKLVGTLSKKFVIVADHTKVSAKLGQRWHQGVPIEVVPPAARKVSVDLEALGAKKVTLRQGGKAKAGPVVTDNTNFILDADFGELDPKEISALDKKIKSLVGVVEVGLFDYAAAAYVGTADGSCEVLNR